MTATPPSSEQPRPQQPTDRNRSSPENSSPTKQEPRERCCDTGRPIFTDPRTGQTVCSCQYNLGGAALIYQRLAAEHLQYLQSQAATNFGGTPPGVLHAGFPTPPGLPSPGGLLSPPHSHPALEGGLLPQQLLSMQHNAESAAQMRAGMYPSGYPGDVAFSPYHGFNGFDLNGIRRKNATRETTAVLKQWLAEHKKNPYPTKGEKIMLAIITKMTLTQVSTWFANARRRLKKENKMTWGEHSDGEEREDDELADLKDDMSDTSNLDLDTKDEAGDAATALYLAACDAHAAREAYPASLMVGAKRNRSSSPESRDEAKRFRDSSSYQLPLASSSNIATSAGDTVSGERSRDRETRDGERRADSTSSETSPPGERRVPRADKPKIWSLADVATSQDSTSRTPALPNTSQPSAALPFSHSHMNSFLAMLMQQQQQQQSAHQQPLPPKSLHPFMMGGGLLLTSPSSILPPHSS